MIIETGTLKHAASGEAQAYVLKDLEPEEIGQCLKLQDTIFHEPGFDPQWFFPYSEEELKDMISEEGNVLVAALIADRMVAFRASCYGGSEYDEIAEALGEEFAKIPFFLLNGAFVDPEYRGNSLQQKMSEHCISISKKNNRDTFVTTVHPENIASIKSLTNIGFQAVRRCMLYGGKYDRLILVKENSR